MDTLSFHNIMLRKSKVKKEIGWIQTAIFFLIDKFTKYINKKVYSERGQDLKEAKEEGEQKLTSPSNNKKNAKNTPYYSQE